MLVGNLSFDETKPVDGENPGEIKPVARAGRNWYPLADIEF